MRRRSLHGLLLALLVSGCAASGTARAPQSAALPEATPAAAASRIAAALRAELGIPGLALAVARGDQLLWSEGFGFADLELRVPATPRQRFRLASVSKLVTTAVAARLVDQGKLDLDAPVRSFLPEYPEAGAAVTSRQLLGHLSGIRHYQPKDYLDNWDSKHFDTVRASLATFQNDPLLHAPGEREHYSTYAYTLLAALLEVAGGASFPELVEREVAKPLGLATLSTDRQDLVIDGRVDFYDRADDAPKTVDAARTADYLDPSYKWAGGGLLMSAEDLARFGAAHLQPGFLSQSTLDALFRKQRTHAGEEINVGLTWRIATDAEGRAIYHHSGNQQGSRAMLLVYPAEKIVIALLSNLGGVPADALTRAQQIATPFLGPSKKEAP